MDFGLTEQQEMLRKSARDFLSIECPKSLVREIEAGDPGYSTELWKKMAALGWMGLALPEEFGGAGLSILDLAVLFEELGRAAVPGPMFSTIAMGALPVLEFGTESQKKSLLPQVALGEAQLNLAVAEAGVNEDPRFVTTSAAAQGDTFAISGTKLMVLYAHTTDYTLVVTRTAAVTGDEDGITVFIVNANAAGISNTPLVSIGVDRQFEVVFENVSVSSSDIIGGLDSGLSVTNAVLRKAAALQCAMMVGGAQMALDMTAQHTKTRIQFERPLGAFQAVQHRLADMFIDINGARWITYQALWRLSEGLSAEKEVAIAKAYTNIACQRIALSAQQLHGGVGVDMDYDLHFYFRQAKAFELSLGSTPFHLEKLEAEIGL